MTKSQIPKPASPAQARQELRSHPAVRNYTLVCLGALFLLVVCLADRGLGWWCLIPALIGSVALLLHWSLGPPMVIVSLTGLMLASARYRRSYPYWARDQVPTLMDLLLCVAVLGYVMGHYRLLSLVRHIFPPDPRRMRDNASAESANRRSADQVNGRELALLVLALPLWTVLSVVVWSWMMDSAPALEMPVKVWRTLCVGWTALTILTATATVAGYLRWATATPEESLLYLQDQLWRPTRREQGSLNRWLVWARLRAQRKKENS
ncbi:MAG TPA: hypothetical protein VN688_19550 [Gemmataceae bacterium]|nr:hypothetical protein [Gemmataceae bacterium]